MNHSCEGNCRVFISGAKAFVAAARTIAASEELTAA
jgi:SET domain-containing protein